MSEQKQISVPKKDVEIIRAYFKDGDELLRSIRAVMLDISPTDHDKQVTKTTFANKELLTAVSNRLHPTLETSKDAGLGQLQDVWAGVESMVFGQHENTIKQAIGYKDRALKMTKQALALLENPDGEKPRTRYEPSEVVDDPLAIELQARNMFIKHIDTQLLYLWVIANQENKEEVQKRLKQDNTQ